MFAAELDWFKIIMVYFPWLILGYEGESRMREILPGILIDPEIRGGKPVIKGTRVPVDILSGKLAGGATYEEVMQEYDLTREQIFAALRYQAVVLGEERVRATL